MPGMPFATEAEAVAHLQARGFEPNPRQGAGVWSVVQETVSSRWRTDARIRPFDQGGGVLLVFDSKRLGRASTATPGPRRVRAGPGPVPPERDDRVLAALRKGTEPGPLPKVGPVLAYLGFEVVMVDRGHYRITIPGVGPVDVEQGTMTRLPYYMISHAIRWSPGGDPASRLAAAEAFGQEVRVRAARALGLPTVEDEAAARQAARDQGGRAARAQQGGRTCGACWNVQQTDRAGRMVHHGYQRPGWGYIVGDCPGVGLLPWEVSTEGAAAILRAALARSEQVAAFLRRAEARDLTLVLVVDREERIPHTWRTTKTRVTLDPGSPEWLRELTNRRLQAESEMRHLWHRTAILGIPWIRAAIREWAPQAPPAGIPRPAFRAEDYLGRPDRLG